MAQRSIILGFCDLFCKGNSMKQPWSRFPLSWHYGLGESFGKWISIVALSRSLQPCFVKTQELFLISCKWPELHWMLHWKQWKRVTFRCTAMIKKFTISYIYKSRIFVAQSWSRRCPCLIMLMTWLRLKSWNWMADLMPWSTLWAQDYAYALHKDPMTFHHQFLVSISTTSSVPNLADPFPRSS